MKNKFTILILLLTAIPHNSAQAGIFWDSKADKYEHAIKACQGFLLDHTTVEDAQIGLKEFRNCVDQEKEYYYGKK